MKYSRLRDDLDALARFGAEPSGGNTRRAYTPADLDARRWLAERMAAAGLVARVDPAFNVIGRLPASVGTGEPAVLMLGSHIDTVPNGGPLDGTLGVLAGLEVARRLQDERANRARPLEIVAFEDEEGRFGAFTGSRAMMGFLDTAQLSRMRDTGGVTLADALSSAGLSIEALPNARRPVDEIAGYLELHIEQGPILERKGLPIGIIDAIAGQARFSIRFEGRPDHAGSTPMGDRQDAFAAAALFATSLRQVVVERGEGRAVMTIGIVKIEPGAGNVVPALARLGLEIRDTDGACLRALTDAVEREARNAAATHGLEVQCRRIYQSEPAAMDARLRGILNASAQALALPSQTMASAAGHDAQIIGRQIPSAMIFVPSKGGRSHCPEESTAWEDVEAGVDLLYEATRRLLEDPRFLSGARDGAS
ncbi:MAG TPA: Zn-dependent hydrolase [Alphaproteobacteria bacterium]|nr:Zn-dependent hydrolase [Alphaproteobacteria bacterium]